MASLDSVLQSLDEGVTGLFTSWNGYSTALATVLVSLVTYRIVSAKSPDIHPMLLLRQTEQSHVRMPGESPVFGSRYTDRLTTGLNVKDPDQPKWARGRDGDLRDVWRQFVAGVVSERPGELKETHKGKILSVFGTQQVEHKPDDLSRQILAIGQSLSHQKSCRVAIYLPNSVELLTALFACAFADGPAPVLIPFNTPDEELISMLSQASIDTIISAPGAFPFDTVAKALPTLSNVIWVVDEGSSHMDWSEVPEGTGGSINVSTWQDIVADSSSSTAATIRSTLENHSKSVPKDITVFWKTINTKNNSSNKQTYEMVHFSHANIAAAVAAQLEAISAFGPDQVFLPATSLASMHTLVLTLAALFSSSSVVLKSVADSNQDLELALQGTNATIVAATPTSLAAAHAEQSAKLTSSLGARVSHWLGSRSLLRDGYLPATPRCALAGARALELIITADCAGAHTQPALAPHVLSDLRLFARARIVYAMTAARVAGAVAQTMAFDYRVGDDGETSHFGAPPRCVQVVLKDTPQVQVADNDYRGEIFARGPCVVGKEAGLGVVGVVRHDGTLAYA